MRGAQRNLQSAVNENTITACLMCVFLTFCELTVTVTYHVTYVQVRETLLSTCLHVVF